MAEPLLRPDRDLLGALRAAAAKAGYGWASRKRSAIPDRVMADAFIGLGGNIGDVRSTFDRAIVTLCDDIKVQLAARSSDYRTPPWGVTGQPAFINAVIAVTTSLSPRGLLARTQECERVLGRDRAHERRWGPRAIDVDVLDYDDLAVSEADLILPHPRLFERAFVLVPLAEIAPERVIAGRSVREALSRFDVSGFVRLPPRST